MGNRKMKIFDGVEKKSSMMRFEVHGLVVLSKGGPTEIRKHVIRERDEIDACNRFTRAYHAVVGRSVKAHWTGEGYAQ